MGAGHYMLWYRPPRGTKSQGITTRVEFFETQLRPFQNSHLILISAYSEHYVVVFVLIWLLLPFMLCIPEFTLQTLGEVTIEDLYGCVVTGGS